MSESTRRAGGSCRGGILGAVVGIVIGWLAVQLFMTKPASDPNLPILSGVAGFLGSMAGLIVTLLTAGFLGIVGAIGGSIYGSSRVVSHPIVQEDDEIAELKRRLSELERSREKPDQAP
jgi:hypothetical protein